MVIAALRRASGQRESSMCVSFSWHASYYSGTVLTLCTPLGEFLHQPAARGRRVAMRHEACPACARAASWSHTRYGDAESACCALPGVPGSISPAHDGSSLVRAPPVGVANLVATGIIPAHFRALLKHLGPHLGCESKAQSHEREVLHQGLRPRLVRQGGRANERANGPSWWCASSQ